MASHSTTYILEVWFRTGWKTVGVYSDRALAEEAFEDQTIEARLTCRTDVVIREVKPNPPRSKAETATVDQIEDSSDRPNRCMSCTGSGVVIISTNMPENGVPTNHTRAYRCYVCGGSGLQEKNR